MRIIIVSVLTLLLASKATADGRLMKYRGISHYTYDYKTGELTPGKNTDTRRFNAVWDISTSSGYFTSLGGPSNMAGAWGDMDPAAGDITAFTISYATNSNIEPNNANPIGVEIVFYNRDNGRGDLDVTLNTEFAIDGLPALPPEFNLPNRIGLGFVVDIVNIDPFNMRDSADEDRGPVGFGCDLVGRWGGCCDDEVNGFGGYLDFGYTYLYRTPGDGATGSILAQPGEPNMPCPAPGATNQFDLYNPDPNSPVDPNKIVHKAELGDSQAWFYSGSFWFGGDAFSGFYLTLSSGAECADTSCDAADVNGDCAIDLFDLATLLGNFATTDGARFEDGDLDRDGDVDLTDLAIILSAFGSDCR